MSELNDAMREIEQLEAARKYPQALAQAKLAVKKIPRSRPLLIKLAALMESCKQHDQALVLYQRMQEAVQKEGGTPNLQVSLGMARCQIRKSQYEQAAAILEPLRQSVPADAGVLAALAACRRHTGSLADAEELARAALQLNPGHQPATHELARVLIENKEIDQAIELLEQNIRRPDLYGDSIDLWIATLGKQNRNRYAQDMLEQLVKEYPESVEFVFGFAVLANRAGETSLARPAYEKALQLSPNNYRILYELGVLERIAGNLQRSRELVGQALTVRPDNPAALRTYGNDEKYAYGDDSFSRLNYVAAKLTDFNPIEQIHMHYALAKAYDDVEELDTAYRHYGIAGEKKRKIETYNEKESLKLIQIISKVVTKENLQKNEQKGCDSEIPVFILGMPRSGTSLIEQVLSSHPDIFGAGELKFLTGVMENIKVGGARLRMGEKEPVFDYDANASYELRGQRFVEKLQKLAGKPYPRIVDKMPGNFNFVGLIHAVLPNARIIHSRRHPVETCLSCYRIHFAEGHQWTYNLRELGRFYRRYWSLMEFWRKEFPGAMYEVHYEDNVADIKGQAHKLIDYLGLEWNENCLNFYNTDRPVKTASASQVRKPIYTTSTNRWRKYEKYLRPLIDELGDVIEIYEAEIAHLTPKV